MGILNMVYGSGGGGTTDLNDYLCFTANTDGSTVTLNKTGSPTAVTLETSTDKSNWTTYIFGNTITLTNIGDKVYWRNTSETDTNFSKDSSNYYKFTITGSVSAGGDINYLLNKNSTTTVASGCYRSLFEGCTSLVYPPKLTATTLNNYCYINMFKGCTALKVAPELPASKVLTQCYHSMFYGCTSLTRTPELNATSVGYGSYNGMFRDCSNIVAGPTILPALTLSTQTYQDMFWGCSKLLIAPSISATTLGNNCCINMFWNCSNLITLPSLKAKSMKTYCYNAMFSGCSKIKLSSTQTGEYQTPYRIPEEGTGTTTSASYWNTNMFRSTGGTTTSVSINTTYYTSNTVV